MKYLVWACLLPLMTVAQDQNQTMNYFGNHYFPDATILLRDSLNIYFKKTSANDTVFRIPVSKVRASLKGVPEVNYQNADEALLKFNNANGTGVGLQLCGIGVSLIGYTILVAAVTGNDDSSQKLYKTGGYIAVAGGALSLIGLGIEFGSHRHLKRFNIMVKAIPYQ